MISAENNNNQEAMILEIQQLRSELQRVHAMKAQELRNEKTSCPAMAEALCPEVEEAERKRSAERLMLAAELSEAKHELEDLQQQLHTQKVLRMQAETEKLEAVEIAEALFHKLDEMQRVSEERSAERCVLLAQLKTEEAKQEVGHEILELQQTLHKEQELRNQAEAHKLTDFEFEEAFCKEVDRRLQKERELRTEAERSKLEAVQIREALLQKLEEARTLAEKLSAESQTLADKLKRDEKKQEVLNQDVMQLIQMLDKETALRIQAENYELEAMEVLEVLQKRRDGRRSSSSARTRTSCGNTSSFSPGFRSRRTRRAEH